MADDGPHPDPPSIFKTPSGPRLWQEADSLLPDTPIGSSGTLELTFPVGDLRRARLSLYGSHFLSTWGQRAWEFLVALAMLDIHPTSLLLVSIFGLCDAAAIVIFGPVVGAFVDSSPRLPAATSMYIMQNTCVAISAASCLTLVRSWGSVSSPTPPPHTALWYWVLVSVAIISGSLSSVGALGATLSVEREWVKALSAGDSTSLASMNASMKRIDLTCLIASPIGVGLLMTWRMDAAVGGVLLWNLLAWWPECRLLHRAMDSSPVLHASKGSSSITTTNNNNNNSVFNNLQQHIRLIERAKNQIAGWRAYARQPACTAALSLALIYLTVMSFGTLMTAWVKWSGITEVELSIWRAGGAVSGIAATFVFPWLQTRWGLVKTGAAAIVAQVVCLVGGAVPIAVVWVVGGDVSEHVHINVWLVRVLLLGLVFSRFGLWGFDLAVNQILQETVPSASLGTVTGVQGSLQSLFQMLAYVAGVVVWQPQRFVSLMVGSVGVVGVAASIFLGYALRSGCDHVAGIPAQPEPITP